MCGKLLKYPYYFFLLHSILIEKALAERPKTLNAPSEGARAM